MWFPNSIYQIDFLFINWLTSIKIEIRGPSPRCLFPRKASFAYFSESHRDSTIALRVEILPIQMLSHKISSQFIIKFQQTLVSRTLSWNYLFITEIGLRSRASNHEMYGFRVLEYIHISCRYVLHVCVCVHMNTCTMQVCIELITFVRLHVVRINVCMHVCMYICMFVCLSVCMFVCMYVYKYRVHTIRFCGDSMYRCICISTCYLHMCTPVVFN